MLFPISSRRTSLSSFLRPTLLAVLAALLLLSFAESRSRGSFDVKRAIAGDGSRGPYALGVTGLISGTDSVWVDGVLLVRGSEYSLVTENATLVLAEPLARGRRLTFAAQRTIQVLTAVRRRECPSDEHKQILTTVQPAGRRQLKSLPPVSREGNGIEVSGVKRFQVAIGTSSEAALNQSLQLEISGMLSDGVRVKGFLSDRSLPVQAEGRSQSVQDLDRVHLEVASSTFRAGLGDVDVDFGGTTFGRYHRQLEGARLQMKGRRGDVDLYGAVSEGARETRRIDVRAGYQGPYRLSAGPHQISAGSERLYLNGVQLRRGEGQDYVIDYDRGLITFMPGRPIMGESRVTAEFQTVDPAGRIRSLGLRGQLATGDGRLRLGTTLIRESRGTGVPVASGTVTLPSHPPQGPGALLSSVDGAFNPSESVHLEGEVAWARSVSQVEAVAGHAARVGITLETAQAREQMSGPGAIRLTGSLRQIGESFQPFDRVDPITSEGAWGWESSAISGTGKVSELALSYTPMSFATVGVQMGHRTGSVAGHRKGMSLELEGGQHGRASVSFDHVHRSGGELKRFGSSAAGVLGWFRPTLRFSSESTSGTAIQASRVFYNGSAGDMPEGARIREAHLTSEVGSGRLTMRSSATLSQVDQLTTAWGDSARTWTHTNELNATTRNGFQFSGLFGQTVRRDRGQSEGTETVNLGRVRVGYRPGSGVFSQQVQYHVTSTGVADRDRVFVEVADGSGSYVWEDVDGDGFPDDEEFTPESGGNYEPYYGVPTSFEPVRESSVGLRTMVDLGRGRFGQVIGLRNVALEVALESDRRGRTADGVTTTPWSHLGFVDEIGVVSARREVRSTVHLFRRNRKGSIRVDGRIADDLNRRLSEEGRTQVRGWVFIGKLRPLEGWDVEARAETEFRDRAGEGAFAHGVRERGLEVRNWVRLPDGWQTGLALAWGHDREDHRALDVRRIAIGPELRRALKGRGRFTSRFDWTRVDANDALPLFLGLAKGHRRGQNYRWRLGVDYRLGTYVDAFVMYDGTVRPERPALHLGRMELRARF